MSSAFLRTLYVLSSLLLLIAGSARAQGEPGLAIEVNRYYGEEERALIEGAVEVPYSLLTFAQEGDNLQAAAKVEVTVENASGEAVYHTERDIQPQAVNPAMAASSRVSSIETFAIYTPPGAYTARARVTDLASQKSYEATTPLDVPADRPLFSDVLLSGHVQKDVRLQEGSYLPYLIGTTMYNPNPRDVFYKDAPLVYFYYEVNPEVVAATGAMTIQMTIRDGAGEVIKDLGPRSITVGEGKNFDLGAFNIGGLAPGAYALDLRCSSCADAPPRTSAFVVRPPLEQIAFMPQNAPAAAAPGGGQPPRFYAELTPAQVDSVIDVMEIWFTPEQQDLLVSLNPTGKVQFLNRFWESLDADASIGDPATPENEAKMMFERRVAYADQFFASSQRQGHDTDRGRIYLLFGEPSEQIDRPVEATLGPYEIWNYSGQGHTFAFGDFRRDGNYRLIYSTHQRFVGDPTIQTQVDQPMGATSARESFLPQGRGYEVIIEDIRTNRTTTGLRQ